MPVTVVEKFDSRHLTTGVGDSFESGSLDLNYIIFGTDSEQEAQTALAQTVPAMYGLLETPDGQRPAPGASMSGKAPPTTSRP